MPSESIPEDERLALARALRHVGEDTPERTPENREEIARLFGEENPEGAEDYGAAERRIPRVRLLHVLIGLLALACLALVVPLALDFFGSDESGELPVIAANEAPDKVRPEEPGGLQVQHQDIEVMNPSGSQPVERLLPPPESPEPLPGTIGGTSVETGGLGTLPDRPTAPDLGTAGDGLAPSADSPPATASDLLASVPEPQPSAEVGTVEAPPGPETVVPTAPETPALEAAQAAPAAPVVQEAPVTESVEAAADNSGAPAAEAPAKPAAEAPTEPAATQQAAVKPTAPAAGDAGIYIQLGSLSNKDAIPNEWSRLQKAFPDFLGDMQLAVQTVNLEGRGTFHRIQTGPLPNRGTAEELCAFLKDAKQACLVVKR